MSIAIPINLITTIKNALLDLKDPYTEVSWSHYVKNLEETTQKALRLYIEFPYVIESSKENISHKIHSHLRLKDIVVPIEIEISSVIKNHIPGNGAQTNPHIKNIIAVASGKGGVGKSTTAVNLAIALSQEGARVGLLDADIYGPNQPAFLGTQHQKPVSLDQKHLEPVMNYGIQSMSIAYLIDESQAVIWRGPMVSTALQQLLNDTAWNNLDYLIIDLPPGTGDIQLTLAQKIPVTAAIVVTTPQEIALLDVKKSIAMFEKVRIPVLGIIENMSTHTCSQCGHTEDIFGEGGGQKLAQDYHIPLLAKLPLDKKIRQQSDRGHPIVIADPDSPISEIYKESARKISAKISTLYIHQPSKFPKIVME